MVKRCIREQKKYDQLTMAPVMHVVFAIDITSFRMFNI